MKRQQADKSLQNVAAELKQSAVNSHQAQQLQQDTNDRRHQDALNHDHTPDKNYDKTTHK